MAEFFSSTSETDDDSSESSSSKKKKKLDLGKAAVQEKPRESIFSEKKEESKAERSIFDLGEKKKEADREKTDQKVAEVKGEVVDKVKDHIQELPPVAATEAEAPPDGSLGEEENKAVVKTFVRRRREQIESEVVDAEADPEKAAENLAAIRFLEAAEESGDPEAAISESSEDLDVELPEAPALEVEPDSETEEMAEVKGTEEAEEATAEEEVETDEEEPVELGEEETIVDRRAEIAPDEDIEDEPTAAAATGGGSTGSATAGTSTTTGSGTPTTPGGGFTPPPFGPGGPTGGGPGGPTGPGGPFGGGFNPNFAPAPVAANTANTLPRHEIQDGANPATMALFGGIIGYFIGRRRGRKLERREQMKVRRKLEKNIENLEFDLREKEKRIRKAAAQKVRQEGPAVVESFKTKIIEKPTTAEKIVPIAVARAERAQREGRIKAPEAHQLHGASKASEKIGSVLVAAEAPRLINRTETAKLNKEEIEKLSKEQTAAAVAGRRVETLNRSELLSLSEKIMVGDSSLRQIYETKLIGERGLRRLITEHLRGGDIKKALRQEILEREIDFERDPLLRDLASSGGAAAGGGTAALNQMIAKAQLPGTTSEEEVAYYKARANFETAQNEHQQKQRQLIDISLATIIFVLMSAVVLMIIL